MQAQWRSLINVNHEGQQAKAVQRAWIFPEPPWGAPPEALRESGQLRGKSFVMWWNLLICSLCLYKAIFVPYVIGFIDRRALDRGGEDTCVFSLLGREDEQLTISILIFDILVELIFCFDILLSFHLARWIICREGRLH